MNHTLNHYIIGGVALLLGGLGIAGTIGNGHRLDVIPHAQVSHFAWPGLTGAQSGALAAAMAALPKADVTIWCHDANCTDLAEDLQYAAYNAGWATHSDDPILGLLPGLTVEPDDATARALAAALQAATGAPVKVANVPGHGAGKYDIILGQH